MFACRIMLALCVSWPATVTSAHPILNLRGSPTLQQLQNQAADREHLVRIKDDAELKALERSGQLIRLPHNRTIRIDPRLDPKWHWCRPVTAQFLDDLARDYYRKFGHPLQINSAVRTVDYQNYLRVKRHNANAAPTEGDERSSHLTGATIDIAKKCMSHAEIVWMRNRLLNAESQGLIIAIEEYHQTVFHVMVLDTYELTNPAERTAGFFIDIAASRIHHNKSRRAQKYAYGICSILYCSNGCGMRVVC